MKKENGAIYMEQDEYEKYLEELHDKMNENKENAPLAEISLYELNKQMITPLRSLSVREYPVKKMKKWITEHINAGEKYYMLLCNELGYYTLFVNNNNTNEAITSFMRELTDIISGLGNVKIIEVDNNNALAIWADYNTEEAHCFYLFPYDRGVVEF